MFKIKVNEQFDFQVRSEKDQTLVNDQPMDLDIYSISKSTFHILHENRSYNVELVTLDKNQKTCSVRVNKNIYTMSLTDQFDELLHKLGMDNLNSLKITELKAPMPGLVLKVLVKEGEEVSKGSNLLILEAMKMENIIKAPTDGVIKSIKVNPSDKVEKNQVMIVFN
ncbi:acetyl-CoA carboxylase biotin carboxyl carrier protein subunit [Daejeonella lutea]|uniref:Biotin-requiring enzyme n=1 Tax=Daejeonella lutea TaxID=572036 RepID=A0A1T5D6P5_9SPHI|nr:acetyl-CoA carboxylase biotin carboxyl carrier protein subunit [Daejeonella lutea]SKB67261.1 Biotin-requiring enzyme [Daejeonella lutea]